MVPSTYLYELDKSYSLKQTCVGSAISKYFYKELTLPGKRQIIFLERIFFSLTPEEFLANLLRISFEDKDALQHPNFFKPRHRGAFAL